MRGGASLDDLPRDELAARPDLGRALRAGRARGELGREELSTKAVQFAHLHQLANHIPTHGHNKHKVANVSAEVRAWMNEIYAQDFEFYARLSEIQRSKPLMTGLGRATKQVDAAHGSCSPL